MLALLALIFSFTNLVAVAKETTCLGAIEDARTFTVGTDIVPEQIRPEAYQAFFQNKKGIEIGGPSAIFKENAEKTLVPIYGWLAGLDNAIFDGNTLWAKELKDGGEYMYQEGKPTGKNFVRDGTNLEGIADASYEVLLTSHNLEHMANPMKAMAEYVRVLKPGGSLMIALPYPPATFDHKRSPTTMDHLLEKWRNNVPETDLSHLAEIVSQHDLSLDPNAPQDTEGFRARGLKNFENRGLHQHVFNFNIMSQMCQCFQLKIEEVGLVGINMMMMATKPTAAAQTLTDLEALCKELGVEVDF